MNTRPNTWLSKRLHRWGIARLLNTTTTAGFRTESREWIYVQTRLPIAALARYASRQWDVQIVRRERIGRFRWRWHLERRRPRW